jgi:hypothetical protein
VDAIHLKAYRLRPYGFGEKMLYVTDIKNAAFTPHIYCFFFAHPASLLALHPLLSFPTPYTLPRRLPTSPPRKLILR